LDPNARRTIWEVIGGLKFKGKNIILKTYYLDEAQQLADRVAIMDHGRIVAMGTTKEIIQQHGAQVKSWRFMEAKNSPNTSKPTLN
jgi:ABC-2 type transport system ATP-binding protein